LLSHKRKDSILKKLAASMSEGTGELSSVAARRGYASGTKRKTKFVTPGKAPLQALPKELR
jgi:hypothetical protein